jgi:hypothetical protein
MVSGNTTGAVQNATHGVIDGQRQLFFAAHPLAQRKKKCCESIGICGIYGSWPSTTVGF